MAPSGAPGWLRAASAAVTPSTPVDGIPCPTRRAVDRNSLLAIALSAILFFAWQAYLDHKYPNRGKPAPPSEVAQTTQELPGRSDLTPTTAPSTAVPAESPKAPAQHITVDRPL